MPKPKFPQPDPSEEAESAIPKLSPHLQGWVRQHLVKPYRVRLFLNPEGQESDEFLILTDRVGIEDSSCRVVFNPRSSRFGLEMTLEGGRMWYMGDYGSFDEAVESM